MKIGRKIFYETATGNIIIDTGERQGSVIATTVEQDIATFTALSERNRDTFDVIELAYGEYAQDFTECNGYRMDVETGKLEFNFTPDVLEELESKKSTEARLAELADLQKQTDEVVATLLLQSVL